MYDKETGEFAPRLMLPLSLSYDHRVIDGADGIRFLRWVVEAFEQPFVWRFRGSRAGAGRAGQAGRHRDARSARRTSARPTHQTCI